MSDSRLVVGLDAGGSKTHLRAVHASESTMIERYGDGANPNQIGIEAAADVLAGLVASVLQDEPAAHVSLCAGVAGAGRADEQQALTEALHAALRQPDRSVRVEVVSDAQIALDAAYDTGSGVVVIAGTGSMVLGRSTENDRLRAGGWGHVLGDAGSGHALGRAGLRAVAEAFDGGTATTLRARLRDHFGVHDRDDLLTAVYQSGFDVASVAPLVLDAAAEGDAVVAKILDSQVNHLADQVGWLLNRTEAIAPHITLLGGLLENDYYEQCLRRHLRDRFPNWTVKVLQEEPVVGALRRARRLQSNSEA